MEGILKKLKEALANDHIDIIKQTVKLNKEVLTYFDKNGRTLLFDAVLKKNLDDVKSMVNLGFNVNLKDIDGRTPLQFAVMEEQPDMVEFIISSGADVNSCDNNGNSVINDAVFYSKGKGEIIHILKKNGANPYLKNKYGVDAISLAKSIANYNIVQYF